MENLLRAQLLALDWLILTPFVTNSQLWGHWYRANKSSFMNMQFVYNNFISCQATRSSSYQPYHLIN